MSPWERCVCQDGLQLRAGKSCFSSRPFEIQGFQQLLPFPSPRGTFHVGAAPEGFPPPSSLFKIPVFVASG